MILAHLSEDAGLMAYSYSIVDDIENSNTSPKACILYQNYPNPFNPFTTIEYELPNTSTVELSIFNLLGQKVVSLISKKQHAGKYAVNWDGYGFSSGLYIYQLKTETFMQSKKMLLIK